MKWISTALFSDQIKEFTQRFGEWNECEKTVVLYALIKQMPPVQARFLAQAIQHSLFNITELDAHELNANNPAYIGNLKSEPRDRALGQLLTLLPLLRPANVEAKRVYLEVIQDLLSQALQTSTHTEQTQQLLSYVLIHPAISSQERRSLTQLLRHLEERISCAPPAIQNFEKFTNNTTRWEPAWNQRTTKPQQNKQNNYDAFRTNTGNGFSLQFPQPNTRQRRSNSLTPPVAPPQHMEMAERQNNLNNATRHKPRSFSVSGDNSSLIGLGPLSPQSSCTSSGSEGRLDEASCRSLCSGMRDVPAWLKTLRLHKYSYLFTTMSYDEMLELTEDQLAEQGVTKGARHKLALSIVKLQQRFNTLINLEKDLIQPAREGSQPGAFSQGPALLVSTLDELNNILATPMKPSQENDTQDIPAQFTRVLGKLCSRLALESVDDGVLCGCINILEKVLQHDCFTPNQKEKVQQWRSRLGNPRPTPKWQHTNYGYSGRRFGNGQNHNNRKPSLNLSHIQNNHTQNNSFMISPHRNSISTPYLQNNLSQMNQGTLRTVHIADKRPSLQENSLEILQRTLQRTYSAPRDQFLRQPSPPLETTDPEINSRLESLCLRMTEQAIGGFGEA